MDGVACAGECGLDVAGIKCVGSHLAMRGQEMSLTLRVGWEFALLHDDYKETTLFRLFRLVS